MASGGVATVRVTEGLSPGARGFSTVEVQWRRGMTKYTTEVLESWPPDAKRPRATTDSVTGVVGPDLGAQLKALDPDLRVVPGSAHLLTAEHLGRRFPEWTALVFIGLMVSSYLLLILGPRPWRATRWAWFWLLGIATPAGTFAFLLLGGPTSIVPGPQDKNRRLTGGWAFLISLVVSSAVVTTI